jgi:hypothetical protein
MRVVVRAEAVTDAPRAAERAVPAGEPPRVLAAVRAPAALGPLKRRAAAESLQWRGPAPRSALP